MKRIILTLLFISMILSLTGCGNEPSKQEEPNPILEKIYMNNTPLLQKTIDFDFLEFYDDNTFQGIEVKGKSNTTNHYGTYTIDGNALTLNLSDKTYAGVILDDGAGVTFGSDNFVDWTSNIKDTDPILEKFK